MFELTVMKFRQFNSFLFNKWDKKKFTGIDMEYDTFDYEPYYSKYDPLQRATTSGKKYITIDTVQYIPDKEKLMEKLIEIKNEISGR